MDTANQHTMGFPVPKRQTWAPVLVCLIFFASAPVFAALTWEVDYRPSLIRFFSVPILAAEMLVVVLALLSGFDIRRAIGRMHPITRFGAIGWLVVASISALLAEERPHFALLLYLSTLIQAAFLLTVWDRLSTSWSAWNFRFLAALAIGTAVYFSLVFMLAYSQKDNPAFDWHKFGAGVSHVRHLSYYGVALAGIAAGLLAVAKLQFHRISAGVLLTAGFWLIFWSGGRSAVGAGILVLVAIAASLPTEERKKFAAGAVIAFVAAIPLSYLFVPPVDFWGPNSIFSRTVGEKANENFSSGRYAIWISTIETLHSKPLIGFGEGQFRFAVPAAEGNFNHPHNALLQYLFQWGILGSLALATIAFPTMKNLTGSLKLRPEVALPAFGAVFGLCAQSALDGPLYYPYPAMIFLVGLATLASIGSATVNAEVDRGDSSANEPAEA